MGVCEQFLQIFLILIKLKSWRFLFMLPVIGALVSNLYLYRLTKSWTERGGGTGLNIVGPNEFQEVGILVGDTDKDGLELSILAESATRMSGVEFNANNLEKCTVDKNCQDKFFKLLVGRKQGKVAHYVNYHAEKDTAKLQCQIAEGSELYCPYLAYLIGVSQSREPQTVFQFLSTHAFVLRSSMAVVKKNKVTSGGIEKEGPICTTDLNFTTAFPSTLMTQMILVTIVLTFYLLISTASCIHMLKQNGFLQIMFRRGLSVIIYWLVLWMIILLEMAIFAAVLTVSYNFQCSGFYSTSILIKVFLCSFVQFSCMAAIVLFLTLVTSRVEISSLIVCLLSFLAIIAMVVNRNVLSKPKSSAFGKYVILAVPFGHIAEQMYTVLMQGEINTIDNFYYNIVLPVTGALLVVLILATIYLDFVLATGCGRNLPLFFLFNSNYCALNNQSYEVLPDPKPSVMTEDAAGSAKPTVRVVGLKKRFTSFATSVEGLKDFSGQFYLNQITAIVGHNGSGKSTLMRILSGECLPTSGKATVNHKPITDPICRTHVGREIGYCPQTDALVDSLTMRDSLKLAACSSGVSWDDIQSDVNEILCALQIEDKLSQSNSFLSSSDKRKACIAMALIGKPYVVLLDHPTRDMDFISKRRLWKLLHDYKRNHVVIISTLSIEEADSMSDKMVFMSGGRNICAGSSFFFKRAFDCRFIVQIASKTEFHVPFIIRKITSKFNSVRVRSFADADLELEVPLSEDYILPDVALEIESLSELIYEFGIAHYSLDDVFSKLKPLKNFEVEDHFRFGTIGYVADDVDRMRSIQSRLPELPLAPSQAVEKTESTALGTIASMLIANFLQLGRSKVRLVIRIVVPLSLLIVLIVCAIFERRLKNEKMALRYSLSDTTEYERNRGVCLHYYGNPVRDPHFEVVTNAGCSLLLTGINNPNIKGNAEYDTINSLSLNIHEFKVGNFRHALLNDRTNAAISKACRKSTSPCPIIWSTSFCIDELAVINSSVSVGTYVTDATALPMSISMATIELYKNAYVDSIRANIKIGLTKPYSSRTEPVIPQIDAEGIADIRTIFFWLYALFVQLILLALMPSVCMSDVFQDKQSGVMKQLMSLGLSRFKYWLCTFVNHWIQLAVVYILSTIFLIAIVPAYSNPLFILGAVLPTLTFGLANSLLCIYCICSVVESNAHVSIAVYTCYSLAATFFIFIAPSNDLVVLVATFALPQFAIAAPSYFCGRLINYSLAFFSTEKKGMPSLLSLIFYLRPIRDALIAIGLHFILFIVLLILLENRRRYCSCCKKKGAVSAATGYEKCNETSIVNEVQKIDTNPKSDDHIMEANHLQASDANDTLVLKDLTIGLKHGETIALLGPCSSGKSSAVRAMVGEKRPVGGRVDFHIHDRWLCSETAMQQGFIGYCPKIDPLIETLKVRENLQFYGRAAGVSQERIQLLMRKFHLDAEMGTIAMRATAGVKRRLTLAIAVLRSPQFIAIDQAAVGVDPDGRQVLWEAIRSLATQQGGIIIATQEMEEAEKLCDRICIMNGGQMAALSTLREIIARYKKMYFLEIEIEKLANETIEMGEGRRAELIAIFQRKFPGAMVIQQLTWRVQFGIPIKSIDRLSTTLSWLLDKKSVLKMVYFTIHYATVDQTMKAIVVHHEDQFFKQQTEATVKAPAPLVDV